MRHALRLLGLAFCCWFGCAGCRDAVQTSQAPKPHVYDVGWLVLVRDVRTASSYTGQRIRVRLDPTEYVVADGEVRVYANDNGTPPVLVFRGVDRLPQKPYQPLSIVGTCRGPTRDGHWRSRNIDYVVTVEECSVTLR